MHDHEIKWFAFLAVKEGILTPHMCREIADVLGDDNEMILFAEVVIANELASSEDVQRIIDRAWKKAQNPIAPPRDVFVSKSTNIWGAMEKPIRRARARKPKTHKHGDTVEFVMDEELLAPEEIVELADPPIAKNIVLTDTSMNLEAASPQPVLQPLQRQIEIKKLDKETDDLLEDELDDSFPDDPGDEAEDSQLRFVASKTKEILREKLLAALNVSTESDSPPQLSDLRSADQSFEKPTASEPLILDMSIFSLKDVSVDFETILNLNEEEIKIAMVKLLKGAQDAGASDLHISANSRPFIRVAQGISFLSDHVLTAEESRLLNAALLSPTQETYFMRKRDYDYALALDDDNRFRVNLMMQKDGPTGNYRLLPYGIRSLDELGFRNADAIRELLDFRSGLILVVGPAGSGKTATLAAMIAELSNRRKDHIISIEDPVEIIHRSGDCNVTQRELTSHTKSYHTALKGAMHEDAGVIVIGELSDLKTIEMAIAASETGQLVIASLRTTSVVTAMNRLLHVFPPAQQLHIRAMVAESLRGVLCQQLLPNVEGGVTVACELLLNNLAVANHIRGGKTHGLRAIMDSGNRQGMCTMDHYLLDLYRDGIIAEDVANAAIVDRATKNRLLSRTRFDDPVVRPTSSPEKKVSLKKRGTVADG